jgi:hypothetical protein
MSDPLKWAAHYRKGAAECARIAENSPDPTIESHFRYLPERYLNLAKGDEDFASRQDMTERGAA